MGNFVSIGGTNPTSTPGWPPLFASGGNNTYATALLFLVASFFLVSLIPKVHEVVAGFFSGKFQFGNAMGEAVSQPFSAAGRGINTGVQYADTGLDAVVGLGLLGGGDPRTGAGRVAQGVRRAFGGRQGPNSAT